MKKVLLSGIQPTGTLHIGNYFGAIKQFVDMQDTYESYVFIADLHALTTVWDKETLKKNVFDIAAAYMACGLDPQKVTLYRQSAIGGLVSELTWIFNCVTTVAYLERGHAYKDSSAKQKESTMGLLDYPALMAADILIQDPHVVPVGQDQKQHIEFTRDIAQKFNNTWGEVCAMPEPLILESVATVVGTDGRKMSKSYGNTIPLFGTDEELEKAVMGIVTDSSGDVPVNVRAIHELFRSKEELDALYTEHKGKYKALKEALLSDVKQFVAPLREKYEHLQKNPELVWDALKTGEAQANNRAEKKMVAIKQAVGLM